MPMLAPNDGLTVLLSLLLRSTISGLVDWDLRLWKNDYVPTQATTWANLTEATFGGYSRVTLARVNWSAPEINTANKSVSIYGYTPVTWSVANPAETLYGYAICDSGNNRLFFVERFLSPQILAVGKQFALIPRITMGTDQSP